MDHEVTHLETAAVHAGGRRGNGAPAAPAIAIASAYQFDDIASYDRVEAGVSPGFTYSRDGSPTSAELEVALAQIEGGESGVALSAGVAAISMTLLSLLPKRGTVVAAEDVFGGTNTMLREVLGPLGFEVRWVDFGHLDAVAAELSSCDPGRTVVLCESISNPMMQVPDLAALSPIVHAADAVLVVDNTFATPWFCTPLAHGADVVLHSASKYLGGHHDLVGGIAVGRAEQMDAVRTMAIRLGARLDPFASWLALRGVRTLPLRMRAAGENAQAIVAEIAGHPAVETVLYPTLESGPIASRILVNGYGAMVSMILRGGLPAAEAFVEALEMIKFVGSLGDVATSVSHPPTTSHRNMAPERRRAMGIADGFIRMSIGIEYVGDILDDIRRGLDAALAGAA
jgi:cystathionine beta-lyase/cystathionine gamma-synthase